MGQIFVDASTRRPKLRDTSHTLWVTNLLLVASCNGSDYQKIVPKQEDYLQKTRLLMHCLNLSDGRKALHRLDVFHLRFIAIGVVHAGWGNIKKKTI